MSADDAQALAKSARRLIAPSLEKIYNVSTGRKFQKLRQNAKDLLESLPRLLSAAPKPAKPAGRSVGNPGEGPASPRPDSPLTPEPSPAPPASAAAVAYGDERVAVEINPEGGFKLVVVREELAVEADVSELSRPGTASSVPTGLTIATPAEVPAADSAEDPAHFQVEGGQAGSAAAGEFQVLPTPLGINPNAAQAVLTLLREAVETRRPPIVEVALDCIQKLLAHRLMSGPVFHINHRREAVTAGTKPAAGARKGEEEDGGDGAAVNPERMPVQAQAIELLCLCDDIPDEVVERRVLKGLLTAITSTSIFVHGQALLLAVRACYNIFLMSRDETNRVTAKATLTQVVNAVFQRMEAGDFVLVKPIVVTDVLGMPSANDSSISASVQAFLQEVVATVDLTGLYVADMVEGIQRGLDVAFSSPAVNGEEAATPKAPILGSPATPTPLQLAPAAAAPDKPAAAEGPAAAPAEQPPAAPEAAGAAAEEAAAIAAYETQSSIVATDGGEAMPSTAGGTPLASPPSELADDTAFDSGRPVTPPDAEVPPEEQRQPASSSSAADELPAIPATAVAVAPDSPRAAVALEEPAAASAAVTPVASPPVMRPLAPAGQVPSQLLAARSSAMMARTEALLQKDAFLVFRALCKLSIKTADATSTNDQTIIRGKELALELLKILLENSGEVFRATDRFISAIKQYLCLSLLKNCTSTVPQVQRLSCSIFLTLLVKFRQSLKAEVGLFYPMILLRPIEPVVAPNSATQPSGPSTTDLAQRQVVLKCLETCSQNGQLLVDLFVNYDCDLEGANLLERMVQALVKLAQGGHVEQGAALSAEEKAVRVQALRCLVNVLSALVAWYARTNSPEAAGMEGEPQRGSSLVRDSAMVARDSALSLSSKATGEDAGTPGAAVPDGSDPSLSAEEQAMARAQLADLLKKSVPQGDQAAVDAAQAQLLESFKEYKRSFQAAIQLFNTKPKKGLALLQQQGFVGTQPAEVARFLTKTQGLDKAMIGEYMGEKDDDAIKVMHAFTDAMDFTDHEFDEALRKYLDGFRLPGEAQKIDRFMLKFAERFCSTNPSVFASANVAYVLSYAVIMLNTDAHNPMVKKKMTKSDFLRNIRGINEGSDLNEVYMSELYDRIVNNEIVMKDDAMSAAGQAQAAEKQAQAQKDQGLFSAIMGFFPGRKQQANNEPSDDAIKRTHEFLREQAKGATFFTTTDGEAARPILDVAWAPMLGAFSTNFEQSDDDDIVELCLEGFRAGIRLECLLGMAMLRNTYLSSLARFTHLHSPSTMRIKNARAFHTLLLVAEENGNHLQECWEEVLRCISRYELLQQLAAGLPTDALLFGADKDAPKRSEGGFGERLTGALSLGSKSLFRRSSVTATPDTTAVEQGFFLYLGKGGKKEAELQTPPPEVLEDIDRSRLDRLYVLSDQLDSDAIVEFVRTLCKIAAEELKSVQHPRVFSLTKIVEISHFNMGRVRIVWSRIWSVLADFFIEVGCHKNLQVAMYAVDSLRQLSMKFLERDELANFTFQNDFLRPFVFVMRQSKSVEIRELIIRCVSQMILARVSNVKSGWKSMFMVFTTAANDEQPQVVRLAFETIEKIVREYFSHITETETTTFTDCVNCLIAFTNNPHSLDVSLNAIAFLRYCAIQLAEGEIAMAELEAGQEVAYNNNLFRVRDLMDDDTHTWSSTMSSNWDDKFADQNTAEALAARKAQQDAAMDQATAALGERRSNAAGSTSAGAGTLASPSSVGSSLAGAAGAKPSALRMRFTDKDEHMYFWFPLLAGLSELTFDPRQEIRQSALEVLFDTLEFHGHSFTPQFWARVFDSVLLPIFDHVRAEVTDTTTFTDERRRADVDAWLYETCTQCLQHIVDLVVKFYPVVKDLLPRILDLLQGFVRRPHHSLAAVGVAGMVRLIINAGISFSDATWAEVLGGVGAMAADTLPAVGELVSRIERRDQQEPAGTSGSTAGSDGEGSDPLDIRPPSDIRSPASNSPRSQRGGAVVVSPRSPNGNGLPAFSLSEGSGARRMAEVRCRASVQLLVVQACGEIYAAHSTRLRPRAVGVMLDILQGVSGHARDVNSDMRLRHVLAWVQATDKVQEDKQLPDPPLLRLESEGSYAYLSMLLHIRATQQPEFHKACHLEPRLVQLCAANLERYEGRAQQQQQQQAAGGSGGLLNPDENVALSPLVVATLKAISGFPAGSFQRHLPGFFPLLTRLIRCDHAPPEVQRSLSELFLSCIGPMLGSSAAAAHANGV